MNTPCSGLNTKAPVLKNGASGLLSPSQNGGPPIPAKPCSEKNTAPGVTGKNGADWACPQCGHVFTRKSNLVRHLQRKLPCAAPREPEPAPPKELRCADCGKSYTRQWSFDRHLREGRCEAQKAQVNAAELAQLERRMAALRTGTIIGTQNNTINHTQINITVQVPLRDFGEENLTYVTQEWYRQKMAQIPLHLRPVEAAMAMARSSMEGIWADPAHPENWNVILDTARGDPLIVKDGRWAIAPVQEISSRMQSRISFLADQQSMLARKTDKEILTELIRGEGAGLHISTAKTTMKNIRAELAQLIGRAPRLGEAAVVEVTTTRDRIEAA